MTKDAAQIALVGARAIGRAGPSDAELVERARRQDAWAEAAIYQRHAGDVANLAARLLGNRSDALDVMQDVFVSALEELDSLRDPAALRPWLRQRTVFRVHRIFRRRRWWRMFGATDAEQSAGLDALASASASPEQRVELARISERLATLPARQRIAWVLHRVEGETLPETARLCALSMATVKRDIAAAQAALDAFTMKEPTR
jgi:RNA polymerase sigma-70 factor (ECF subfamily)